MGIKNLLKTWAHEELDDHMRFFKSHPSAHHYKMLHDAMLRWQIIQQFSDADAQNFESLPMNRWLNEATLLVKEAEEVIATSSAPTKVTP